MEKLQRDVEYAEYLIQSVKQRPGKLITIPSGSSKGKSIHQKLLELYIEECGKQPEGKDLLHSTHLLPKLVKKERLNTLVLKLYPSNEGYSLMLRSRTGIESETFRLPYEISELLDYIDASELPPILVDILERAQVNTFYSGCVIVEVRDYRRSTSGQFDTQHVLLRPTSQSLLSDINAITSDGHRWTQEDQFQLESQLILATEEPICLDPSPAVLLVANKLQYDRKKFNTPLLRKSVKRFTQTAVNRKRKFAQGPAPKELKLYDFLHRRKEKSKNPAVNLKVGKSATVDTWKQKSVQLSPPDLESIEVEQFAKCLDKRPLVADNTPVMVEEHTLERDHGDKKLLARLTITQRQTDDSYHGELYQDHDFVDGQSKGCNCKFNLGTRDVVDKYLEQFKKIFTEEGSRAVKITIQRPGEPPKVIYTHTNQALSMPGITISNAQAVLRPVPTASVTTNAQGEAVTAAPPTTAGGKQMPRVPLQLSLSIGPGGNINATTNLISPPGQTTPSLTSPPAGALMPTNQLLLQGSGQSQPVSHRLRHSSSHASQPRPTMTPSPVSTPTSTSVPLPTYSQALSNVAAAQLANAQKVPTPTVTPPPMTSPPPSVGGSRKAADLVQVPQPSQSPASTPTNITAFLQVSGSDGTAPTTTLTGQPPGIANINIANIAGLPPNINIQNLTGLQGMNIANLPGLHNMQVSLTVPGGSIAVPISMISTNPLLQNQGGIFVSSLPGMAASTTLTSSANTSTVTSQVSTATPSSMVTMVSSLPTTASTPSSVTSSTVNPQVVMTTGLVTNPSSVLTSPTGLLSLPIGLSQFMAGLKTQPGGLRGTTSLPLLQLQGQQGIQLLNLQQQRGQLKPGTTLQVTQAGSKHTSTASASVPITSAVLNPQTLTNPPQMATLSQLPLGKPGQPAGGTTLTTQQFMQLAAGQQIQAQLAIQKQQQQQQQQQQQIHFHQIQLKQPGPQPSHTTTSKSKSKKRTTPTPPKN